MKKALTGLLLVLTLLSGIVMPGVAVFAEEETPVSKSALEITPSGARLKLAPGGILEGKADHCPSGEDGCSINVKNIGSAAIHFRVYMSPYAVSGENNDLSFSEEAATAHTQLSRWITVKNPEGEYVKEAIYSAEPNQSINIPFRVEVPQDIPGGSQYAVIWAQILNDGEGGGIETVGQIGAVITGRSTENSVETAEISEFDFQKFSFGGPLTAQATVKNTGNVDFAAKYYYTARTLFGKELYKQEDFIAAYADTTYHINVEWEETPFLGIFQVEWKVVAADSEQIQTAVVVIMPVIVIVVVVLLLTVVIIWIIIIIRKSKERKARKLV